MPKKQEYNLAVNLSYENPTAEQSPEKDVADAGAVDTAAPVLYTKSRAERIADANKRDTWPGKLDFILSIMGFNIGPGNLLRFPYLCMKNGGGTFLIPYTLFLFFMAVPMFVIELGLGQWSGKSPLKFWGALCPIMKGIGWSNVILCAGFNVYFNVLMGWMLYYLFYSFWNPLPWSTCDNPWNNNQTCFKSFELNLTNSNFDPAARNCSVHQVLQISSGIHEWGSVRWPLVASCAIAWFITYICLIRGVKSLGRVVYVTVLLPYVLLIILLVRGLLLPGSQEGINFYMSADWEKLKKIPIWLEAAGQIFWSIAPGWGGTMCMATHNRFKNNIFRDALMLPVLSSATSFFGGFIIFSYMGNMAYKLKVGVPCIFKSGPAMAFLVYPDAITNLPLPQLWAALFFILVFILGLDSSFTTFETFWQALADEYPCWHRCDWLTKLILCVGSFLIGIPILTNGGQYIYQILDWYQITFLTAVAFFEIVSISYFYGTQRVRKNIKEMVGFDITIFWDIIWRVLLPIVLGGLTILTIKDWGAPSYGNYKYPEEAIAFGWCLAALGVIPLPIYAVYKVIKDFMTKNDSAFTIFKELFIPTPQWELADGEEEMELSELPSTVPHQGNANFVNLNKYDDKFDSGRY